jgi:hypothetical protein
MHPRSQSSRKAASCAKAVSVGSWFRGETSGGSGSFGVFGTAADGQVLSEVAVSVGLLEASSDDGLLGSADGGDEDCGV